MLVIFAGQGRPTAWPEQSQVRPANICEVVLDWVEFDVGDICRSGSADGVAGAVAGQTDPL